MAFPLLPRFANPCAGIVNARKAASRPQRDGQATVVHELSIMVEAVRIAVDSATAAGAHRVTRLKLRVGVLSGAAPEALQFAWSTARRHTIADGATLEIESVPAIFQCDFCGMEFQAENFWAECPRCHEISGDLRGGRELETAAVEIE